MTDLGGGGVLHMIRHIGVCPLFSDVFSLAVTMKYFCIFALDGAFETADTLLSENN